MKRMQRLRSSPLSLLLAIVIVAGAVIWTTGRAWGIGFYLSQTKEELKLKYDVAVHDYGNGRVSVEFTLEDEGRLKPLDEVQFLIPAKQPDAQGGYTADLLFSMNMVKGADGKRVGRVSILRDLAERAEITLNTHALDGKTDMMTRLHHAIPLAPYLKKLPPAAPAATTNRAAATAPPASAPPATEHKE